MVGISVLRFTPTIWELGEMDGDGDGFGAMVRYGFGLPPYALPLQPVAAIAAKVASARPVILIEVESSSSLTSMFLSSD